MIKGFYYEGTGQKTGSSLREVELQTGKVIRQHNLDPHCLVRDYIVPRQDIPGDMGKQSRIYI